MSVAIIQILDLDQVFKSAEIRHFLNSVLMKQGVLLIAARFFHAGKAPPNLPIFPMPPTVLRTRPQPGRAAC
jgi:hypothetical protein